MTAAAENQNIAIILFVTAAVAGMILLARFLIRARFARNMPIPPPTESAPPATEEEPRAFDEERRRVSLPIEELLIFLEEVTGQLLELEAAGENLVEWPLCVESRYLKGQASSRMVMTIGILAETIETPREDGPLFHVLCGTGELERPRLRVEQLPHPCFPSKARK